jgi:hypothetical protein
MARQYEVRMVDPRILSREIHRILMFGVRHPLACYAIHTHRS